ncbi:Brefeldin A-inhibited guanine nucleotide-exchange protein 1 [Porphyridium purpureum]|uniref:Brefeldin A-inhibited guanine nucleotide-exchange protein 1 n=1 Tax=Porphyridium purpureum TaxID=35688 RepID=A0A5J4YUE4_PORPP|nr:Brefeldin A-inhibited guanine nucleotide-exchange protein 1 [Porphyridium purpureum]|eukprot:POR3496..scf227_4
MQASMDAQHSGIVAGDEESDTRLGSGDERGVVHEEGGGGGAAGLRSGAPVHEQDEDEEVMDDRGIGPSNAVAQEQDDGESKVYAAVEAMDELRVPVIHAAAQDEHNAHAARTVRVSQERVLALRGIAERLCDKMVKAVTSKRSKPLRDATREVLRAIRDVLAAPSFPEVDKAIARDAPERLVVALEMGFESPKPAVLDICLDILNRLFESQFLGAPVPDMLSLDADVDGEKVRDRMLELGANAVRVPDESVFMRCVQIMLTGFKAFGDKIHGPVLLGCVRSVFNIHLNSKSSSVRGAAKAAISQIVLQVFSGLNQLVDSELDAHGARVGLEPGDAVTAASGVPGAAQQDDFMSLAIQARDPDVVAALLGNVRLTDGFLLFRALCRLCGKNLNGSGGGGEQRSVVDGVSSSTAAPSSSSSGANVHASNPDAISPEDSEKSINVRSRVLSMELIKMVISAGWKVIPFDDRYIHLLKSMLLPSLMTNCLSTYVSVSVIAIELTEEIFSHDVLRPYLKAELAAFLSTVIFRFLEIPSAGSARRRASIRLLRKLCTNPNALAELFVNYDCDLATPSIYSKLTAVLSTLVRRLYATKLAFQSQRHGHTHQLAAAATPRFLSELDRTFPSAFFEPSDEEIWKEGLECLFVCIHSLRQWAHTIEESQRSRVDQVARGVDDCQEKEEHLVDDRKIRADMPNDYESDHASNGGTGVMKFAPQQSQLDTSSRVAASDSPLSSPAQRDSSHAKNKARFVEALRTKKLIEDGRKKFNAKPKAGIAFLLENRVIADSSPTAIASYLRNTDGLDATVLGEYLGEGDAFNIEVMHAYTDTFDFSGLPFDEALRLYLSKFRIPGEAQKIDRIMEKFASCYCKNNDAENRAIFANADTAYVLAYSIIMLNTDAHNAQVKSKMSKEAFLRNNRGINDGQDLDPEYLGGIYDRILSNEIRLSDGVKDKAKNAAQAHGHIQIQGQAQHEIDPAVRARLFQQESEHLLSETRILFQSQNGSRMVKARASADPDTVGIEETGPGESSAGKYFRPQNAQFARLMFEISSETSLDAFALVLDTEEADRAVLGTCLNAFSDALALMNVFGMKRELAQWVAALAKIGLGQTATVRGLQHKNVDAMDLLVKFLNVFVHEDETAHKDHAVFFSMQPSAGTDRDGDANADSQEDFLDLDDTLRCISLLQRARAAARGNPNAYILSTDAALSSPAAHGFVARSNKVTAGGGGARSDATPNAAGGVGGTSAATPMQMGARTMSGARIDLAAADAALVLEEDEIELIFHDSHLLSIQRMRELSKSLVAVAKEELRLHEDSHDSDSHSTQADSQHLSLQRESIMFCLEKIFNVLVLNIESRTRRDWALLWDIFAPFFMSAFASRAQALSVMCLDLFMGLAKVFVLKDELSNYNHQRVFLRPLERVFARSSGARALPVPVRMHVLTLLLAFVNSHAPHLRSGWKSVFAMLSSSAMDKNQVPLNAAFRVLENILETHCKANDTVFLETMNALAAFSRNGTSATVATAALSYLGGVCVDEILSRQETAQHQEDQQPQETLIFSGSAERHVSLWFPLISAFSTAISNETYIVRTEAVALLFRTLRLVQDRFDTEMWALVFKGLLLPVFDPVRQFAVLGGDLAEEEHAHVLEWILSTGNSYLSELSALFVASPSIYNALRAFLPDLLDVFRLWITQRSETVAKEAVATYRVFLKAGAALFSAAEWDSVCAMIETLMRDTLPDELFSPFEAVSKGKVKATQADPGQTTIGHADDRVMGRGEHAIEVDEIAAPIDVSGEQAPPNKGKMDEVATPDRNLGSDDTILASSSATATLGATTAEASVDEKEAVAAATKQIIFKVVRAKCVIQLLLIELIMESLLAVSYLSLTSTQVLRLGDALEHSFQFAKEFNQNLGLRFALWQAGFMSQVPNLITQEVSGLSGLLQILFWLFLDSFKHENFSVSQVQDLRRRLLELCRMSVNTLLGGVSRAGAPMSTSPTALDRIADGVSQQGEVERQQERQKELLSLAPCVVLLVQKMQQLPSSVFDEFFMTLYDQLLDLVQYGPGSTRPAICSLFRTRARGVFLQGSAVHAEAFGRQANRQSTGTIEAPWGTSRAQSSAVAQDEYVGVDLPCGVRIAVYSVELRAELRASSNSSAITASLNKELSEMCVRANASAATDTSARSKTAPVSSLPYANKVVYGARYQFERSLVFLYTTTAAERLLRSLADSSSIASVQLVCDAQTILPGKPQLNSQTGNCVACDAVVVIFDRRLVKQPVVAHQVTRAIARRSVRETLACAGNRMMKKAHGERHKMRGRVVEKYRLGDFEPVFEPVTIRQTRAPVRTVENGDNALYRLSGLVIVAAIARAAEQHVQHEF